MNLKLNSEPRSVVRVPLKAPVSSVKEERRRNGRYIAVLVGICLFLLAIYHAWIRRIPVVASLVVPALIMFVYVGWVLYTASRDKHRLQDAEAALDMASSGATENDISVSELSKNNLESIIKESSRLNSPDEKTWTEFAFQGPIILINGEIPDEGFQVSKDTNYLSIEKLKDFSPSRKSKRKFCRSKRHAVFKRSYSIA